MESWDIYTASGEKTGRLMTRGETVPEGFYHKTVSVLVRHADGDYLLTRRSPDKNVYPGWYEATAGGAVQAGESETQAVRRELFEETGIRSEAFTEIAFVRDDARRSFYYHYLCIVNIPKDEITLQDGETDGYRWMSEEEFIAFVNSDAYIPTEKERLLSYFEKIGYLRKEML